MNSITLSAILALLVVSAHCWENECRMKILDGIRQDIEVQEVGKALEGVVLASKEATFSEIYDNYLNYNSDFADRLDQDTDSPAFSKAETNIELASIEKTLSVTAKDPAKSSALVKYFYIGNCCYYFNPCISIKIGYHALLNIAQVETLEDDVITQSFAKAWKDQLDNVVKSKNITP